MFEIEQAAVKELEFFLDFFERNVRERQCF